MNILICDPMDDSALKYLDDHGVGFEYAPDIDHSELLSKIDKFDGILVRSRTKITAQVIKKGLNLKIVGRIGSGYDNIDIETCKGKQITVVNSPDANSVAVAELTIGLVISALREIPRATMSMKKGEWIKNEIWGSEVSGKTVGILGYGYVGSKVDKVFTSMGAQTLVYSRRYKTANLEEIFKRSDIITIHLALTPQTKEIVSQTLLKLMKSDSIIVNIARGQVVNEEDLYQCLVDKKIRMAILDVYWQEPLSSDSRWRKLDNVILTPHIGAATNEALAKASLYVARDVVRFSKGERVENRVV